MPCRYAGVSGSVFGGKMFSVKNHLLYQNGVLVPQRPAPEHGGKITPRLIVIHYTATQGLESPLSWLTKKDSVEVSAHLIVGKDGAVYQLVPFNIAAWHAGKSSYEGQPYVNAFSIGIENVGVGDKWPDAQIEANRAIIEALFEAYPIEDVVGHEDVAPGRKPDPGPRYPWDKVVEDATR
jgi:N-acetylmuramoyl-L-alanine amidase